jgi:hypothetical protein
MPIVVDEVVISVEVEDRPAGGAHSPASKPSSTEDKQALVAECVERVLEILAQREER